MFSLLLAIIYLSFISLGLPDLLLGSAWPTMYPQLGVPVSYSGIVFMIISVGTIISSLQSDRLTRRLGTGKVTAFSVALTPWHCSASPPAIRSGNCASGRSLMGSAQEAWMRRSITMSPCTMRVST